MAKRTPLATIAVVVAALLLMIGCSGDAGEPAEPFAAKQNGAAVTVEPPPTPEKKSPPRQERGLIPTPTLHPQVTAVEQPTTSGQAMEVVSYDLVTTPIYLDPTLDNERVTAVPPLQCDARMPGSDLLTVVTKDFGISKEFAPEDLVALAGHVPYTVTVGYPTEVRQIILEPLVAMIEAMLAENLQPQILSGYRSYAAQAISWDKWNRLYPERAAIISAQPGHSEHQMGTVLDFGSPELPALVGQPGIQFHTYFYKTSEGQWLAENAHKYGFTLSFSEKAFDITGFYYEPWHFRYVGMELAELLHEKNLTLTEYQLANDPQPCAP